MASKIKIKVLGVGGAGGNAVSRMKKRRLVGVDLVAINTDAQDLFKKLADQKLRIGLGLTEGLGTGMNPRLGRQAALEQKQEIETLLKEVDLIFIAAGLGGGTGSGASPVIAEIAKKQGALTVGVVTMPFSFEGRVRSQIAARAVEELKSKIDSLIIVPNDNLLKFLKPEIPLAKAFAIADEILYQAVKGISDLVALPGIVNVDFADIKSIMANSGTAFFGIGRGRGKDRAIEAAKAAIHSPLINVPVAQAKGILFNVSGDKDISLFEINEAGRVITQNCGSDTKVIFGAIQDEKIGSGEMKVTVIATGF